MAISLFGYTISKEEEPIKVSRAQDFATPVPDDGVSTVEGGGYFGTYVELDATAKSESELINRYREAAMYVDVSSAIDEITTEAIAALDDEKPVSIILDDLDVPDNIKNTIQKEFDEVIKLLDFNNKAYDIFRRWYVDGRLYYQKVVDLTNPKKGITELRQIDPRKIKKVRNVKKTKDSKTGIETITSIDEFFVYNDKGLTYNANFSTTINNGSIKIAPDTITFVPSGINDLDKNIILSYLHKAIKPVNQLKMMEDALVIYRLARAPERRIFYIDVGNLPKIKAEQYLKDIMARYRNKIVYDSQTGEIRDDRKMMSMLEDFWLPRREGGRGTEITTLPGGENLGQIEDINYFQKKLYQALNVPLSRLEQQSGFNFGRAAEISRDEIKFAKFVDRLRKKFSTLFDDLLRHNLILKGVITADDWPNISSAIKYKFTQDQYYSEMKDAENIRNRVEVLTTMAPFVGTFFSKKYVLKKVLRLTDDEIEEMEKDLETDPPPPMPQINNASPQ
jgi:hypothetical protein